MLALGQGSARGPRRRRCDSAATEVRGEYYGMMTNDVRSSVFFPSLSAF